MGDGLPEAAEVPLDEGVQRVEARDPRGEVGSRPPPVGRQPSEPHPEDELEDDPEPEDRDDPADRAVQADRDVDPRVPPGARDDPREDPDRRRDEHGPDRELDRRGELLRDYARDEPVAVVLPDRDPEVPAEDAGQVAHVLDPRGLGEPQARPRPPDPRETPKPPRKPRDRYLAYWTPGGWPPPASRLACSITFGGGAWPPHR